VAVVVIIIAVVLVGLVCAGVPFLFWARSTAVMAPATVTSVAAPSPCSNNLRQIGMALHNYHDVYRSFPPAIVTDKQGKPMHSWRVAILPFLGHQDLYQQYDQKEPWDGPKNRALAGRMPPVYRCPNSPSGGGQTSYVMVTGEGTIGGKPNEATSLMQVTDGTANTIAVVEVTGSSIQWMEPKELSLDQLSWRLNDGTGTGPSSPHPGGVHVLFCDCSTHFLMDHLDPESLRRLLLRGDGMPVDYSLYEGPDQ
jgi:prepilin-type processing-associated H-X9-DG protein